MVTASTLRWWWHACTHAFTRTSANLLSIYSICKNHTHAWSCIIHSYQLTITNSAYRLHINANRVRALCVLSCVISHADRYCMRLRSLCHFLGNFRDYMILHWSATREIIARIYIYVLKRLRFRPQTPSSRTISALNSANVGVLLPARYVKPRIMCKRNDAAFVGKFVPLVPSPGSIHSTDPLVNYSQSPLNWSLLRWRRHYGLSIDLWYLTAHFSCPASFMLS